MQVLKIRYIQALKFVPLFFVYGHFVHVHLVCMGTLSARMHVHLVCTVLEEVRRALAFLGLDLRTVVSHHVGAGN